jgi:hypothetical protein
VSGQNDLESSGGRCVGVKKMFSPGNTALERARTNLQPQAAKFMYRNFKISIHEDTAEKVPANLPSSGWP